MKIYLYKRVRVMWRKVAIGSFICLFLLVAYNLGNCGNVGQEYGDSEVDMYSPEAENVDEMGNLVFDNEELGNVSEVGQVSEEHSKGKEDGENGKGVELQRVDPNTEGVENVVEGGSQVDDDAGKISISFSSGMALADALRTIAEDAGVNIVISPEVTDTITSITFANTPWEEAIATIVQAYGYGYERKGNTIIISPLDKIIERKKKEMELKQVKELETRVFTLHYIDAGDALKVIETLLSPRGSAEILESTYLGGWKFVAAQGQGKLEKAERKEQERKSKSKKLVVTDIRAVLDKIEAVLKDIDRIPQLVLIESNIVEVDWHKLIDLGLQLSLGDGTNGMPIEYRKGAITSTLEGILGALGVAPFNYDSPSSVGGSGFVPDAGMGFLFRHLSGNQFSAGLRALEELADANVLSAPKILTLSNQEASILVGTKYPIVNVDKQVSDGTVTMQISLEYYQDLGVQLNVVPQVCGERFINMIIHPAVVEKNGEIELGVTEATEGNAVAYPIMDVREAETQVMIRSGDVVVIGGLMKDQDYVTRIGVPLLSDLPVLGRLFSRNMSVKKKQDLFIFVSAKIVKPEEIAEAEDVIVNNPLVAQIFMPKYDQETVEKEFTPAAEK